MEDIFVILPPGPIRQAGEIRHLNTALYEVPVRGFGLAQKGHAFLGCTNRLLCEVESCKRIALPHNLQLSPCVKRHRPLEPERRRVGHTNGLLDHLSSRIEFVTVAQSVSV